MEDNLHKRNWHGKFLLLVEDDFPSLLYLKQALEHTGVTVSVAQNVEEALKYIYSDIPIDLVLLDLRLPDGDGFEIIQKIKSHRKNLPIVVQSAYALSANKEKAFQVGCDEFITKPIHRNVLLSTLDKYLNQ